jgi:CRISPR-associated protein Cas2
MRLFVFFDLPVVRTIDRKNATNFRRFLLKDGYDMIQFSVYCRICNGYDGMKKHKKRLTEKLPPRGSVRMLVITEKQFEEMNFLVGNRTKKEELITEKQLTIF